MDNKRVVEAILSASMVDDKILRLDVCALKESLKSGDVQIVRDCARGREPHSSPTVCPTKVR